MRTLTRELSNGARLWAIGSLLSAFVACGSDKNEGRSESTSSAAQTLAQCTCVARNVPNPAVVNSGFEASVGRDALEMFLSQVVSIAKGPTTLRRTAFDSTAWPDELEESVFRAVVRSAVEDGFGFDEPWPKGVCDKLFTSNSNAALLRVRVDSELLASSETREAVDAKCAEFQTSSSSTSIDISYPFSSTLKEGVTRAFSSTNDAWQTLGQSLLRRRETAVESAVFEALKANDQPLRSYREDPHYTGSMTFLKAQVYRFVSGLCGPAFEGAGRQAFSPETMTLECKAVDHIFRSCRTPPKKS